jgi:hypothetical protein
VISGAREKWTQTNAEEVQITAQENTRFSRFTQPDTEIDIRTAPKPRWNYRTSGQRPSKIHEIERKGGKVEKGSAMMDLYLTVTPQSME